MEFLNQLFNQQQAKAEQHGQQQQQQQQQPNQQQFQQQQVPAHQQQQSNQTQPAQHTAPNPGNNNQFNQSTVQDGDPNKQQQQHQSPLDSFSTLFDNEQDDAANKDPSKGPSEQSYVQMDQAKLQEIVNKMNFLPSGESHQELIEKARGGDFDAMMQVMNHASRNNYMQQSQLLQSLLNQVGKQIETKVGDRVPEYVRESTATNALLSSNPNYKHKAIQPLIKAVQDQVAKKYPQATPQELTELTTNYMRTIAPMFQDGDNDQQAQRSKQSQRSDEMDWTSFLFDSE